MIEDLQLNGGRDARCLNSRMAGTQSPCYEGGSSVQGAPGSTVTPIRLPAQTYLGAHTGTYIV